MLALLYLDLDFFKPVNDNYGHEVGDELLKHVAKILKICSRKTDILVRLGGDEFTIIALTPAANPVIDTIAQRIIEEIRKPVIIDGHSIQIGISIGIALYPDQSQDIHELVRSADGALYEAKKLGRNIYCYSGQGPVWNKCSENRPEPI
jgi:diguanylate cyclase (GGDEF)-like protein